jgi:hypothetical protein
MTTERRKQHSVDLGGGVFSPALLGFILDQMQEHEEIVIRNYGKPTSETLLQLGAFLAYQAEHERESTPAEVMCALQHFRDATCACGGPKLRGFPFCIRCTYALNKKQRAGIAFVFKKRFVNSYCALIELIKSQHPRKEQACTTSPENV